MMMHFYGLYSELLLRLSTE